MKNTVIKFYSYFYNKVSGRSMAMLKDTELKMVDKFVSRIGSSVGEEFIFRYMCYQFYYWHNLDTKFGRGNIPISWVIGDKAYSRWKDGDHWYRYSAVLFDKFNIRESDLIIAQKSSVVELFPHEEKDKGLFYNTDKGLIFCTDYTTMYNPLSELCVGCINKSSCISVLKRSMMSVYKARMEVVS